MFTYLCRKSVDVNRAISIVTDESRPSHTRYVREGELV